MITFFRTHFRRPHWLPVLFIIAATCTTSGLGAWQLKRLAWKQEVVAQGELAQRLPVLGSLPEDISGLEYRKVNLTGTFLYDKVLHMIGRQEGNFPGYFMVTPFKLEDDGRIILVNRGFAPVGQESLPAGEQRVEGIIRPFRTKRFFAPANVPDKNVWFYEDVPAMSASSGLELTPLMVEVVATEATPKDTFPIPGKGEVWFRNDHLGYAITWFGLSLVGLIMFGFYHRKSA